MEKGATRRQAAAVRDGDLVPAYVAVVGPGDATAAEMRIAERVGELLAEAGVVVVCGGLDGVMAAVSKGVRQRGGLVVGLLPGRDRAAGNAHLSVALPTGLGELRNGLVVAAADAVIAVGGSWGTSSEIALAMRTGKPVVSIAGWPVGPGVTVADTAEAALASLGLSTPG